jgi:hypothetical protein
MLADADRSPATVGNRQPVGKCAIRFFTPEVEIVLKAIGVITLIGRFGLDLDVTC